MVEDVLKLVGFGRGRLVGVGEEGIIFENSVRGWWWKCSVLLCEGVLTLGGIAVK